MKGYQEESVGEASRQRRQRNERRTKSEEKNKTRRKRIKKENKRRLRKEGKRRTKIKEVLKMEIAAKKLRKICPGKIGKIVTEKEDYRRTQLQINEEEYLDETSRKGYNATIEARRLKKEN